MNTENDAWGKRFYYKVCPQIFIDQFIGRHLTQQSTDVFTVHCLSCHYNNNNIEFYTVMKI